MPVAGNEQRTKIEWENRLELAKAGTKKKEREAETSLRKRKKMRATVVA